MAPKAGFIRTLALAASVAALAVVPAVASAGSKKGSANATRYYRVSIINLTTGQPLTPPVLATHNGRDAVFGLDSPSRYGVQQVAENGGVPVLAAELNAGKDLGLFSDVVVAPGLLVPAGLPASAVFQPSGSYIIAAKGSDNRISWVSMLICTNDGFTGLDGLKLPKSGETVTAFANAYDTGSERNTESFADIVGGCQGATGVHSTTGATGTGTSDPGLFEDGIIREHAGVLGAASDGLLPSLHSWDGPVAQVTVTAIG